MTAGDGGESYEHRRFFFACALEDVRFGQLGPGGSYVSK